ncbi:hypothetical protein BTJ68_13805 [Hortaea werneckii EXF-2000]|uniref:NAD-dependent epimerase/dehydratase domain-containing protein n=1 Tax=Hortaea werneckii EXF-2000 TaxID=1157616 RepID=A0A1Z5SRE9_HORWE|nr:hypothetical protein BTJ68_13805 [Hortaea werneckii EXF-2000]
MAPKVFITGATGYIAGDATHRSITTPILTGEYSLLVRNFKTRRISLRRLSPMLVPYLGSLEESETLKD